MGTKYSYEFIKSNLAAEGLRLITKKERYSSTATTKLLVECKYGHKSTLWWSAFQYYNQRCKYCSGYRFAYGDIKVKFEERGYMLLSKSYENTYTPLKAICPNGHEIETTYKIFRRGQRCRFCFAESRRLDPEYVKEQIENEGYILLNEYKVNTTKLYYICPNGHKGSIMWHSWSAGARCKACSVKIAAKKLRYNYKFVKNTFDVEGYKLLTGHYKNARQHLEYICPYGHRGKTTFANWYKKNPARCNACSIIHMTGPNNPRWRGGISTEPYCVDWTIEFKEYIKGRDGDMCLNPYCKKISSKLVVHHVDYDKKNCNHTNLITLCNSCNSLANKDRDWHTAWYQAVLNRRYGYKYGPVA